MSKRFADTDKYKKPFIKGLPYAYKLFWDYICLDCDHAGIWQVDIEVAQIRIGKDAPINAKEALRLFNEGEERIEVLDSGKKWYIRPFTDFQYGPLDPKNRVHFSVINILTKEGIKGLTRSLQGPKDKDMDKDSSLTTKKEIISNPLSNADLDKAIAGPEQLKICPLLVNGVCTMDRTINAACYIKGVHTVNGQVCVLPDSDTAPQ